MNLPDFKDLKLEMDRAKQELILLKQKDDEISKRKKVDFKNWIIDILFYVYKSNINKSIIVIDYTVHVALTHTGLRYLYFNILLILLLYLILYGILFHLFQANFLFVLGLSFSVIFIDVLLLFFNLVDVV